MSEENQDGMELLKGQLALHNIRKTTEAFFDNFHAYIESYNNIIRSCPKGALLTLKVMRSRKLKEPYETYTAIAHEGSINSRRWNNYASLKLQCIEQPGKIFILNTIDTKKKFNTEILIYGISTDDEAAEKAIEIQKLNELSKNSNGYNKELPDGTKIQFKLRNKSRVGIVETITEEYDNERYNYQTRKHWTEKSTRKIKKMVTTDMKKNNVSCLYDINRIEKVLEDVDISETPTD